MTETAGPKIVVGGKGPGGMLDERGLSDLIAEIYDAAREPALWDDVLSRIARSCGGRTAVLYEFDRAANRAEAIGSYQIDPGWMAAYEGHYSKLDVWNRRAMARPIGVAGGTQALISDAELARSEFYNDHLRHVGIFYGAGGVVDRSAAYMSLVGVQRAHRAGPFGPDEFRVFDLLFPHLRRALRLRRELGRARVPSGALVETLDHLAEGVILVDRQARPVFLNAAASALADAGRGLRIEGGRLAGATPSQTASLRRAIATAALAAGGRGRESGGTVMLRTDAASPPLRVTVSPLRTGGTGPRAPCAVLFVQDDGRDRLPLETLRRRHGLTAAETRLLGGLGAGKTLKAIAAEQCVSVNTLRVHLQRLFAKTGLHRQSELVRLVTMPRPAPPDRQG